VSRPRRKNEFGFVGLAQQEEIAITHRSGRSGVAAAEFDAYLEWCRIAPGSYGPELVPYWRRRDRPDLSERLRPDQRSIRRRGRTMAATRLGPETLAEERSSTVRLLNEGDARIDVNGAYRTVTGC
jgi:hypothetical protein